jgi:hypothetical protein
MRNFLKIADGIDVVPIMAALSARADLWNENDLRTTYPGSPHAQVDDIWLMFNECDGDVVNDIQTHPHRGWYELPVQDLLLNLMRRVNGVQLGRAIITRLAPGASIAPHQDQGAPATFYQRYHIALQSLPGCVTRSGEEVITFAAGEAYWFNNRVEHEVVNNSADDRIVIVVDIRVC